MDPHAWSRVSKLLEGALGLDPEARDAWLRTQAPDDPELVAEVRSMLEAEEDDQFLKPPEGLLESAVGPTPEELAAGSRVGAWEVLETIGSGGMGVVYAGRRADDQFEKKVAIKVVKKGMDSEEVLARFRQERQVLADLDHVGIARLLDGGVLPDGRPFIAMEYIEGSDLLTHVERERLDFHARLELFLEICEAVAHAHARGIVHRDIKPSNILINPQGRPKLMDFGIAKVLHGDPERTDLTRTESRPMTLQYAAPEQVLGAHVETSTDVYALGVVLYRLLAATSPYEDTRTSTRELEEAICYREPSRPSVTSGNRRLSGDMDTIVMMALRKEPERRYPDADAMARDIRRFIEGRTIEARPTSHLYRVSKFARRNRAALTLGVLSVLGIVVAVWSWAKLAPGLVQAREDLSVSETRRERSDAELVESARTLQEIEQRLSSVQGTVTQRRELLETAIQDLESLADARELDADLELQMSEVYSNIANLQGGIGVPNTGQIAEALVSSQRAEELLEKLVESRPDWSLALQRLSIARLLVAESRYQLDELELSEEKLEEALATAVSAFDAATTPKLLSEALFSQTRILSRRAGIAVGTGRLAEAISAQEQSLELVARAVAIVPEKAEKLSFTRAHELDQMSILYCYDSRYEDAERVSLEALDIYRSLHLEAPQNAVYERGLVLGLNSMGRLSVMQKEPADALPYYSEALSIARERSRRSPDDIEAQRDLGYCNFFTAVAQGDLKQFDLALESYLLAGECFEGIYERQPESAVALRDHTMCALSIADTYVGMRRYTEAMERGEACLKIYEEIVAKNPENLSRVRDVVVAKNIIGGAALSLGKDESLSPGERRTYLEAARNSFQGALDRFEGLDEAGMLMESDRQYLPMLGSRLEEIERVGEEITTTETEPGGD